VVAGKKKDLATSKSNATSVSSLERHSGGGCEARTSRDSPQLHVSKIKAEDLSSADCPPEPASRCPAPGHLFGDGPTAQGTTGELTAQRSRQLGSTEGGLGYAAVVAGRAGP